MPAAARPANLLPVRLAVSLAQLICGVGGIAGSGVQGAGSSVRDFAQGAFRPETTLVAPAEAAFSIWGVIYLGLVVYTLWCWVPGSVATDMVARTGWWAAASMALNGAWIFVARAGWLAASVLVMAALTLSLGRVCLELVRQPLTSGVARLVVNASFGLFLGWSTIAAVGNVASALVRQGVPATGGPATVATVLTVAGVALVGVYFARRLAGMYGVAAGVLWGLAWLVVQRSGGTPQSLPVALAASAAAAVVAAAFATTAPGRARAIYSPVRGRSVRE